jgi:iron only hydrogenase large subunit-like protein
MDVRNTGIVYTLEAKCRDCYRCLRVCPVNAIGIHDGQAYIDDDKCIKCGTCIRECPQKAKTYRKDLDKAIALLSENKVAAASIAPSFAAAYPGWMAERIPSALRKLGFAYVSETSDGAKLTAQATVEKAGYQKCGGICTACPAVVNYTEKYRPDMIERLVKIVSPMIAHARLIKRNKGNDCKVVFFGPCVAKKGEADRPEYDRAIDAALTFEELDEWLGMEGIDLRSLPESGFDSLGDCREARLFPLPGGMLKTGGVNSDGTILNVMHTSGAESVMEIFSLPESNWEFSLIEPLFCREGCINGPGMNTKSNIYKRRNDVISYASKVRTLNSVAEAKGVSLFTEFKADSRIAPRKYIDQEVMDIYIKTGKAADEFQLNCSACGFTGCREMAVAVLDGNAEIEMCMPYMRRMAESRKDLIIETSPNGIVILDDKLTICSMNPAFRKAFMCTDAVLGRKISYLMDDVGFEKVASGRNEKFESVINFNGAEYHQLIYKLGDDSQYVGIFSNISNIKLNENILEELRRQTAEKAEELLKHQLEMAEKVAMFLGESTAKSEELLEKLIGGDNG